jgi:hypothetical protein
MAFDPYDRQDFSRLWSAIHRSRETMDLYDLDRTEIVRDFAGPLYSPYNPRDRAQYIHKLNTTGNIYTQVLCFNQPRCTIDSFNQRLYPACRKYETNVNKVAANMDLRTTLQECVLDAFFLMSAVKVRMADAGLAEIEPNVWLDVGRPWVERVSWSDLMLDMPSKSLRSMRFFGDRYRAPFYAVRDRDDFDESVTKKMAPSSKQNQNAEADRADMIATGNAVDDDELEPMCWLLDVYLPGRGDEPGQFCTLCADNDTLWPLKVQKWYGHKQGPYKFLSFGWVPDNPIPDAVAPHLVLLDRLMNSLYAKLAKQAKRQKSFVLGPKGSEQDVRTVMNTPDGGYSLVVEPKSAMPVNFPGVDGNTHAFFLAAAEVYNTQSGNERALGGLATEADTATQEQMLARGAGGRIAFLKSQVNQFASDIMREIGCLMYDDETLTVHSSMEIEQTGYHVDTSWRPGEVKDETRRIMEEDYPPQKHGKFNDRELRDHYEFQVKPNSMSYVPPEMEVQKIDNFVQKFIMIQPAIMAGLIDPIEYARLNAEYLNLPQLLRIVKQLQQVGQESEGDHAATKAPVTSRETVRNNRSQGPQGTGMQAVLGQVMQGNRNNGVTVGAGA